VVDGRLDVQGDRKLAADLIALSGRQARSVAACLMDLAASPRTRSAFLDADPKTRFEIGSVTKGLTGMLLADAIERGEVSLNTTIGDVVRADAGTRFGSISLKELCTHTSGLPRMPRGPSALVRALRFQLLGIPPYRGTSASDILRVAARQRLSARGEFRYSNLGAAVLGQLLAVTTGIDYGPLMTHRIFDPLRMTASAVTSPDRTAPPGWSSKGRRRPPWTNGGLAPAGGVFSSLEDMARLAEALLDGSAPGIGSLVPIDGVEAGGPNQAIGMFWIIVSTPETDWRMIWHNGQTGGYSSFFGLVPRSSRATIVLANVSQAQGQQPVAVGLALHFSKPTGTDPDHWS
jgi:CubicO group peptidase (beta-lactamase class C family)